MHVCLWPSRFRDCFGSRVQAWVSRLGIETSKSKNSSSQYDSARGLGLGRAANTSFQSASAGKLNLPEAGPVLSEVVTGEALVTCNAAT